MKLFLFLVVSLAGALYILTTPEISFIGTYYTGVLFGSLGVLVAALWS